MNKVILTYGTFDLFHVGHLNLLNRLKDLGSYLIVGVSTDEFNELKGKKTIIKYEHRYEIVKNIKSVDLVLPERSWDQKIDDIKNNNVQIFAMGNDWQGKFDHLKEYCEVVYLPRTEGVSSTSLKSLLRSLDKSHVNELKKALDIISDIVSKLE
jgi:glycerol-3-phosphate cytidylyltransferase